MKTLIFILFFFGFSISCFSQVSNKVEKKHPDGNTDAYCSAGAANTLQYIKSVKVGSIYNITGRSSGGYASYTSLWTAMTIGTGYQIAVANGFFISGDQCGIWVDWNKDQDFTDAGETLTVTGTPGAGPYTATITPPATATAGDTRMRIRIQNSGTVNACTTLEYGEIEDYTIKINGTQPVKNLGINEILSPMTGPGLTGSENIQVRIFNFGTAPQSNFEVTYQINDQTPVNETINSVIEPSNSLTYTFLQKGNFLPIGNTFNLYAFTSINGDENSADDGITVSVYNGYPLNQNIVSAEYFINSDPGEGNGIPVSGIFNQQTINLNLENIEAPVGSKVYTRILSGNGKWSAPVGIKRLDFFPNSGGVLVYAEYFVGSDPGQGNGIPVDIVNGTVIVSNIDLPVGTRFYLRTRDSFNRWSAPYGYKRPPIWPNSGASLVYAEYYINEDPGYENGIPLTITNGTVNMNNLPLHNNDKVFVRVKDSFDRWSASSAISYKFKGMSKAQFKVGKNGTALPMSLYPPQDSTCSWLATKENLTVNQTDSVFVRFQSEDGIYSAWKRGIRANAGNDATICQGGYATLNASGGSSYIWNNGMMGASIIVQPPVTTKYWVTISDGLGAWGVDTAMVFVNPLPYLPDPILGQENVCAGQNSLTYTVAPIPFASAYSWTLPSGASGSSNSNTIIVSFSAQAVSGNITVKGTNSCGTGPVRSLPVTINLSPPGLAGLISGPNAVVQGQDSVTYSIIPVANAYSYVWTVPPGASIIAGTGTNQILVCFSFSAVSGTIAVYATNACGDGEQRTLNVSVTPSLEISGLVTYNNSQGTPLDNVKMYLKQDGVKVDSVVTTVNGYYKFSGKASGSYSLSGSCQKTWAGVNSTDALKVELHFVGLNPISIPLRISAADVTGSGNINATDALKIKRRFVGIDPNFTIPDWLFEIPEGGTTISLDNSNLNQDIWGICAGDVNGSNTPQSGYKESGYQLVEEGVIVIRKNGVIEIPVSCDESLNIGAISFALQYPSDKIQITDVSFAEEHVNPPGTILWNTTSNVLKVSFSSSNPLFAQAYKPIFIIKAKVIQFPSEIHEYNNTLKFFLSDENEIGDSEGIPYEALTLIMPEIVYQNRENLNIRFIKIYPNPVDDLLSVEFLQEAESKVQISLYDNIGRTYELENKAFGSGTHLVKLDLSSIKAGLYFIRLNFYANGSSFSKSSRLIVSH